MRLAALAAGSALLAALLFAAGYELIEGWRYERWREEFDNGGWLGKVTVPSPNPGLLWEYRPYGAKGEIRTNRHGFRDRDYEAPAKPEGVYRIAFVGDSVTLGMHVAEEETFVRRFEAKLRQTRPDEAVQALNFGVDGYNAFQVYELVRAKVLAFEPDRVVYVLCLNDFDRGGSAGQKMRYFRRPRSFFLERADRAWQKASGADFHLVHFGRTREPVFKTLLRMRDLLAERRVAFQVVIVPAFYRGAPGFGLYPPRPVHEELGAFLEESGIPALDLLPRFERSGAAPADVSRDAWHLNARGHELVARTLALHEVAKER